MKLVGLFSIVCVFCLAITLFTPSEAKFRKIKIAKKVAKLLFLKGAIRPKIALLPLPLPVPIPIVRKTVQTPISNSGWETSLPHLSTSYEIPSLTSLPESILSLLRPALSTIAASAALRGNNQAWSVNSLPALDSWSPPLESWPSSGPAAQQISQQPQQQQEQVEQQQSNAGYA